MKGKTGTTMPYMKPSYLMSAQERVYRKLAPTVNIAIHIVVTIKVFEDLIFAKSSMTGDSFSDASIWKGLSRIGIGP